MSTPFRRTQRSLEQDLARPWGATLAACILALWGLWMGFGEVGVLVVADSARVELASSPRQVVAAADGQLVSVLAQLGQSLRIGDPIAELDAQEASLRLDQARAQLQAIQRRVELLRLAVASLGQGASLGGQADSAARAEAQAWLEQSRSATAQAQAEAQRLMGLAAQGVGARAEAEAAASIAVQAEARTRALERALAGLSPSQAWSEGERQSALRSAEAALADAEGALSAAQAEVERNTLALSRCTLRAPADGVLAALAPLTPGQWVAQGTVLASVLPEGELRVLAWFDPGASLGRLAAGQPARVRLDALPWTEYGAAAAQVQAVAGELHEGRLEVVMALEPSSLPLRHGMSGQAEVEVERVSPARWLLRAAGAGR